jgi:thiol-disulfide isomerase/thioredoxin
MGFEVGLAPGWTEVGRESDGVDFAGGSGEGMLLVRVARASSTDLDTEARAAVARLVAAGGVSGTGSTSATLSGLPARRLRRTVEASGVIEAVEATVALSGGRAWAAVLTASPVRAAAGRAAYDRMVATFTLVQRRPPAEARVTAGGPAPPFSELDAIAGPVVLNFFATWCGPCQAEMPLLSRQAESAGGRFTVLAVDTRDDPAQVAAFARRLGVSCPIAYDRDGTLGQAYRLPGLPATFFLDAHHVVRGSTLGPLTASSLAAGLRMARAA